jgi:GlcNAc-P-P-Und epimerase
MDKVLITGGSGFIGDLVPPKFPCKSEYVAGDVREPNSVDAVLAKNPFAAIICLAAEHRDFGIERDAYFKTNEYGTRVICDAATRNGVKKIVFFSSMAVYGNTTTPTTEETPAVPVSPYGASKLAGEDVLCRWIDEEPARSVVVLRPTVVFGVGNRANMLRLIIQIDRNRYANIGKADNIKSIAYVDNVVQAALFLMERMQPGMEIFNYSDQPQLSVGEIVGTIADALGKKRPLAFPYSLALVMGLPFDLAIGLTGRDLPISTKRIKKICTATHLSSNKLLRTGFEPRCSNEEGLQRMVAWYIEQKRAGNSPTVATDSSG